MNTLNAKTPGTNLYEIVFTPKGTKQTTLVYVYAKNRLDASNFLIANQIWGKQHAINLHLAGQIGESQNH